jgi:mannose-6-phosphate isomerase-like protein (cupin superfamily)
MKGSMPIVWGATITLAFLAGVAVGPAGSAAGQAPVVGQQPAPAGALPPGDYSKLQLSPDQGDPFLYSGETLRKAHTELEARLAKGLPALGKAFMKPTVTRTHSYILQHVPQRKPDQPMTAEQHEGVTDVYIVVAGSGTVYLGGQMDGKYVNRPGENLGTTKGGKEYKVHAGDILNIPPGTVHGKRADAGGLTYVLMKINVGLYPWSLINGTP